MVKTLSQMIELLYRLQKDRHYGSITINMKDGKFTHGEVYTSVKGIEGE